MTFDEYAKIHPEGERFRQWLTTYHTPVLFKGVQVTEETIGDCCLPGGYLWGKVFQWPLSKKWRVCINDCDDTSVGKDYETKKDAENGLTEVASLEPIRLQEIVILFQFEYD